MNIHPNTFSPDEADIIDSFNSQVESIYHSFYQFIFEYEKYMKSEQEYHCNEKGATIRITMVEMHTLLYIFQHPGCSPSDISSYWGDDLKLPISTILKDLSNTTPPMIESYKASTLKEFGHSPQPGQRKGLFCTEAGRETALYHMKYDIEETQKTRRTLLAHLQQRQPDITESDIDRFFSIIPEYAVLTKAGFSE